MILMWVSLRGFLKSSERIHLIKYRKNYNSNIFKRGVAGTSKSTGPHQKTTLKVLSWGWRPLALALEDCPSFLCSPHLGNETQSKMIASSQHHGLDI